MSTLVVCATPVQPCPFPWVAARVRRAREPWGTLTGVTNPARESAADSAQDLMAAVATGDQAAFASLYDLLSRAVHGSCLGVLRDPDHAAEVAQEVWVEVWRTAARYEAARGSVRTWVTTLAHRRAVDRVRAVQAQRDRDQRVLDESTERPFDVVADDVEHRLEQSAVRDCLGSLTETQRTAVVLAYYGGRTYREVAAELDAALPTVKSRIRDGLLRLKDCLGVTA
ncbi:RNA polymerase sigma factor SigK [Cellulomonas algicola]|uniref:RNA polymerase sigma factor SigK n=1 Tax=Cellulomonas algicola TaxID=2071633 RepID=A0A401UZP2_9CELL|nr:ECF RNA polymerase sigma factor SigK [Cellulomonas algicola]GCD20146.1 RNA polymerase sigma factor SigK [Cellulomonas algicola]